MENTHQKSSQVEVKALRESVNTNSTEFIQVELDHENKKDRMMIDRNIMINLSFDN